MAQPHFESILIEDDDPPFSDALDEFPFFDASDSFQTISKQPNHMPESQSFPSSAGLRRRRLFSPKQFPWSPPKTNPEGSVRGSTISQRKSYTKSLWNLKDNEKSNDKLKRIQVPVTSGSVAKLLTEDSNASSLISGVTTTVTSDESASVTADSSSNSGSNFLFALAGLIIKAIAFQTTLLVSFVTFPIWLMYSSYMFLIDPFAIIRRAKRSLKRKIARFLVFCYGNVRWIVQLWIKRNKSTLKLCLQIGWGLLWAAFVGLILVGLSVLAIVISGMMMKCIMEEPVQRMEQLNFDYTRDTPMAFVPLMSCPDSYCLECSEKIEYGNAAQSRVIPLDHKLLATVSFNMPESDYNRNLGIFQVRVDFLSGNGKPLGSTMKPCMLQFKSQPIRLLITFFKLAPLITGYSSESQTLNIKFSGYTEREVPTSCLRVVLEPRAEFSKSGGVPEIYTAYLKLDSQLPFFKRVLWSWKATVFVWMSIAMFIMGLLFTVLCCTPFIVPWVMPRGMRNGNSNSNNNVSRNSQRRSR